MFTRLLLGFVGAVVLALGGWRLGQASQSLDYAPPPVVWLVALALGGAVAGFFLIPYLWRRSFQELRSRWEALSTAALVSSLTGAFIGLILGALLAYPLSLLPGLWGRLSPLAVSLLLAYLGASLTLSRQEEVASVLRRLSPELERTARRRPESRVLVDTNAIIDGRIAEVSQTGFLQDVLVIPRFVLEELQHIADSPDPLRRNRGRRGLEILNRLRKESPARIQVSDTEIRDGHDVDSKLVKLARLLHCPILTNDYNLNRVAELQGIKVLNLNELANALRPAVFPGEEMNLRIIQEGKEAGQGVGFMDDGTMVVVEGGNRLLNTNQDVVVTRVLQTGAGRIIFAHPKGEKG